MPVYNGENYLRDAIQSVIDQTCTEWELLVIDDGSRDASVEIAKIFSDSRIRIIQNEENKGLIETLNRGLSLARAPLIARLDCDDIALPCRLERQLAEFESDTALMLLGGQAEFCGAASGLMLVPDSEAEIQAAIPFDNPFIHSTVMFRAKHLDGTAVRYDAGYPHAEDYALWSSMLWKGGRLRNLPLTLVQYRIHSASVSHVHRRKQAETALRIRFMHLRKLGLSLGEGEVEALIYAYLGDGGDAAEENLRHFAHEAATLIPRQARGPFAVFLYSRVLPQNSLPGRFGSIEQLIKISPISGYWLLQSKIRRTVKKLHKRLRYS